MRPSKIKSFVVTLVCLCYCDFRDGCHASPLANPIRVAAVTGQQAPGLSDGSVFSGLIAPVINDSGQIAFFGFTTDATAAGAYSPGIWSDATGNLNFVAIHGLQPPGYDGQRPEFCFNDRGET